MNNPNGFGSITKMKRKTRKPYRVRVCIGVKIDKETDKVQYIRKNLGFYSKREEAMLALEKYHREKNILNLNDITFEELYYQWAEEKFMSVGESSITSYSHAFELAEPLHKDIFKDIKLYDLQKLIDTCGKNYPTLKTIKNLLKQMYSYAMKYDLVAKDYAVYVDIAKYKDKNPNKIKREKIPNDKLEYMWEVAASKFDNIALMLVYTGVRISELLNLKKEDIYINEQYFDVIDSKTYNGIRRVPIADKILPLFEEWYHASPNDYEYLLFDDRGKHLTYERCIRKLYKPFMKKVGIALTPHCCRHTCISRLTQENVDPTYIKLIVGHAGAMSLTERVYTHVDIKVLLDAINKI